MSIGLSKDKVDGISLELSSACNLRCRLCAHNYPEAQCIKPHIRPAQEWIEQLDQYKNLTTIILAGILSEPTLYPELHILLKYFKKRSLKVELYTNGNTHDQKWWENLASFFGKEDKIVFTICGSTQELHEKYRVGSSLQQILDNAKAFREASDNRNDYCQHILFEYNQKDLNDGNCIYIFSQFSHVLPIHSLPYQERFGVIPEPTDIKMIPKLSKTYKFIESDAMRRRNNPGNHIICKNFGLNFLWLDSYGVVYPCFLYQLFCKDKFDPENYQDILNYKYDFCFECEEHTANLMQTMKIEQMG